MSEPSPPGPDQTPKEPKPVPSGTGMAPVAGKSAPAGPAPKPATPGGPASPARRHFLVTWLGLAWTAFAFATAAALSTVLRFMYPNVLFEPKMTFKAGKPEDYEVGKVDTRWKDRFGVWIIRNFEGMYALSTVCTHLGCPPNWLENEQKFKCPCHGSGFYMSGVNFEGPAPRPLERYRIVLADDGQILIDKSKKFQYEKGQWSDPNSFILT